MAAEGVYPVRVDASLDAPLSRWLWLVKWLLLIPHYVVLAFLWLGFVALTVVAFFAILFTGRYPRGIFDFNVGVLRWTWRVQYYAVGAFATDQYPPFTLDEDPAYPAHLDIAYPQRLSRGLVLVKWWLLAIPQYIIVGLFTGGGLWLAWRVGDNSSSWPGLIGILAVIAAIVLLVTGRYPEQIFDFVLGLNRWVLRVAAYAGLMTDKYPPFRLDMGGHEPGSTLTLPGPPQRPAQPPTPGPGGGAPAGPAPGWTTGRILSVVAGAVLALISLGALGAGGTALWAETTQRHGGYVDLGTATYTTSGHALASDTISVHGGLEWLGPLIGQVRLRVTGSGSPGSVFAGVAPAGAANSYLSGVAYTTVTGYPSEAMISHVGTTVPRPPASVRIWTAQASGSPTATLVWTVRDGDWAVVVMNADGSPGITARADVAATLPALPTIAAELLTGGFILLLIAFACVFVPVRLVSRRAPPGGTASG